MGQGLVQLIERHLNLCTLLGESGSPFALVGTVALEALRTGLGAAGVDTGDRISAGEARRLACGAGIIPMVLDGDSMPLDLGREQRLFKKPQKIALAHRYGGCATDGCDRPPSRVEIHHLVPWRHGGRTDLSNGLPLCPPHHHKAHYPETWVLSQNPDGTVHSHRRT